MLVESFAERGERAYFNLSRDGAGTASARAGQLLNAFSYRGVLSRGFALVRDQKGVPLRAAAAVGAGMRLDIEFADGRVGAVADGTGGAARRKRPRTRPKASKPKAKSGGKSGQGSLF